VNNSATVYWKFEDGKILPNDLHYDIKSTGQLLIQNAQYSDNGLYTCIGQNSAGIVRKTVNLNVIKFDLSEPPIIREVKLRDGNSLECLIQNADQKDTTWKVNGVFIAKSTFLSPTEVRFSTQ
jgi:hypothetical protein